MRTTDVKELFIILSLLCYVVKYFIYIPPVLVV